MSSKTVWIVHQYGSTPETGMGGRHYYLAEELAKQGHRVYLIASAANHLLKSNPKTTGRFTFEQVAGFTMVWVRMPEYAQAHSKQRAINWFLFPWRIQKLTRLIAEKPDAVLCSSPSPVAFLGAERLAKKFKARLLFEVRDIWPLTLVELGGFSTRHPFIRMMRWVEKRAYRRADIVVSNLKNSVEHMVASGMQRGKFRWIPNGFSLAEVSKEVPLNAETKARLPKGKFIVGYTGTLGVANALDTLIEAAELLKGQEDIAFVLVGQGKEKAQLQQLADSKGLKNVVFIDPIDKVQIQAMLAEFDGCFIGWLDEAIYRFGIGANKIPEYLYSGKPVIHAYGGASDPIKDADAGLWVAPENPEALAAAVLELYRMSPEERSQMGLNGRRAALEQYEYGMLAKEMAKVLFGKK